MTPTRMRVAGFACAWRAWDVNGTPASTAPATPPTKVRRSMLFWFMLTPLCAPRPNVSCFPSALHPRTPKPSPAPRARRQLRHLLELHHLHPLKYELRDAGAARHHHGLGAEVDHRNHQLAA